MSLIVTMLTLSENLDNDTVVLFKEEDPLYLTIQDQTKTEKEQLDRFLFLCSID